jgi:O-antigen/teichoic acid export membrane protein
MSSDTAVEGAPTVRGGSLTMAVGLVLLGISASVYLITSARAVGPFAFGSLSTLWTLIYTFGIGAFLPFEQELGRAFADRRARGLGAAPLVRRVALAAAACLGTLVAVGGVLSPVVVDRLFDGQWSLFFALILTLSVMSAQYVSRGMLAGSGRFSWYSGQLGVEGLARILACVCLLAAGVHAAGPYAWLLGLAPLLGLLGTVPGLRGLLRPGPPASWQEISGNLGWLLLGAVCAQGVANGAMVALKLLDQESGAAGQFLAAFVIARVPLFLFQGVQAVLLPGLAAALAAGDPQGFRTKLRGVFTATGAVALAGLLGAAVAGPWLMGVLFGPEFGLGRIHIVVLAAGTGIYMLAQVCQAGLVALGRHKENARSWAYALIVFVVACLLPYGPLARVEVALVLSCVTAAALLGLRLKTAH